MVRILRPALCGLFLVGLCLDAQAKVTRCTDARTGKVSYTDGLCNSGDAVHEVKIRPTPEEVVRHQRLYEEALERNRQQRADSDAAQADAQRAADRRRALADAAPRQYDYARSPGCADSRGAYELLRIQQDHRSSREYAPLKESAERRMDMDCMGPEAYAERERQREQDRRDKEYREAALRRDNELRDQIERDHRYHQERERERDKERQREREQAQRDQAERERRERERENDRREQERRMQQQAEREREQTRRDQIERERRAAADRARSESRPAQAGLSSAQNGWRGGLRSNYPERP